METRHIDENNHEEQSHKFKSYITESRKIHCKNRGKYSVKIDIETMGILGEIPL